ncbi:MAG: hypothetical protein CL949_08430 [Erythrobacter sp.]|nr:hypothetical protein [Erythrobacter sp.]|tara:strand:- start:585 stop:1514 length:930 start_codon:yes stop_codon:yes gene_type:complete
MTDVGASQSQPVTDEISSAMLHNSGLFLKKAAEEIAGHNDAHDKAFDVDCATLTTVFMQVAVELASTALVLKHEGFAGVTRPKNCPASIADAKALWKSGNIRTLNFEDIKPKAARYLGDATFWSAVDMLQRSRNKLVHFHSPLIEGDRIDLRYEVTHVLLQVIAALCKTEDHQFAFGAMELLGLELFHRLVRFEPYQERSAARAREIGPQPHRCGCCGAKAYLRDEDTCIACGYSSDEIFLRCPSCHDRAVFYDHLNLELNDWLEAHCSQCRWKGKAVQCSSCGDDYLIDENEWRCRICRGCRGSGTDR